MTDLEVAEVVEICTKVFGAEPVACRQIRHGNTKDTWLITLEDGVDVVLQADGARLRDEVELTRMIGDQTRVPVASVIDAGEYASRVYFISDLIRGDNLHTVLTELPADRQHDLAYTIGAHLARLHNTFSFDGHGRLSVQDGTLRANEPQSVRPMLSNLLESGLAAFPDSMQDLRQPIRDAADFSVFPSGSPALLYPWDYRPGNMLVRDGGVEGIIDWGEPRSGPRLLSVAKAEYTFIDWYDLPELSDPFYEGYSSIASLEWSEPQRRIARLLGIVRSAVDSNGVVTMPKYPMVNQAEAIRFHRENIEELC